jgi:hypothetical protein
MPGVVCTHLEKPRNEVLWQLRVLVLVHPEVLHDVRTLLPEIQDLLH